MNLDKDKLHLLRDAMRLYHQMFMVEYTKGTNEAFVRVLEKQIISLRDEIDNELESINNKNQP